MSALKYLREISSQFAPSERANLLNQVWKMRTCIATARLLAEGEVISESGIENCFLLSAELTHSCIALITQPFTAEIGGAFRYTPDALVMTADGPCVVECKPSRENFLPEYRARLRAIEAEFASRELRYVVIDEHDVCGWELVVNLGWLWRVREAAELDDKARRVQRVVELRGGFCTVEHVMQAGLSKMDLHRALADGKVYCDLFRRIRRTTMLQLTPFRDRRDLLSKLTVPFASLSTLPAPPLELMSKQPAADSQNSAALVSATSVVGA